MSLSWRRRRLPAPRRSRRPDVRAASGAQAAPRHTLIASLLRCVLPVADRHRRGLRRAAARRLPPLSLGLGDLARAARRVPARDRARAAVRFAGRPHLAPAPRGLRRSAAGAVLRRARDRALVCRHRRVGAPCRRRNRPFPPGDQRGSARNGAARAPLAADRDLLRERQQRADARSRARRRAAADHHRAGGAGAERGQLRRVGWVARGCRPRTFCGFQVRGRGRDATDRRRCGRTRGRAHAPLPQCRASRC